MLRPLDPYPTEASFSQMDKSWQLVSDLVLLSSLCPRSSILILVGMNSTVGPQVAGHDVDMRHVAPSSDRDRR